MGEESPFREHISQPNAADSSARTFLGGTRAQTRVRLFVGFGLIFLIALGVLYFVAEQRMSVALANWRDVGRLSDLVGKVETGTLRLRTGEKFFLLSGEMQYGRDYLKQVNPLVADLKSLENLTAAEDVRRNISTINDGMGQRANEFAEIIEIKKLLGLKEGGGLQNLVRSWAKGLEQNLSQSGAAALIAEFARLRGIEQRVSTGGAKESDLREITKVRKNFTSLLAKAKLKDGPRKTIGELARKYGADLTQLARTGGDLAGKVARLNEIDTYMAPSLEGLIDFARKSTVTAARSVDEARQWSSRLMVGGGGGAALLFLLAGFILMRSVTAPLVNLAQAATRLSQGDQSVPIPVLGNYDETGDVANALTVFRENMIQADRLRKELEDHMRAAAEASELPEATPPKEDGEEEELPARPEPAAPPAAQPELTEEQVERSSDSALSDLTRQVTETSQLASVAAFEAEKTESMVNGLAQAAEKIKEIEKLVMMINDQSSLLAVQTALGDGSPQADGENLVQFSSAERAGQGTPRGLPQSVSDRIDDIQVTAQRAVTAVREMDQTIERVNDVAVDFAAETSNQALNAATDLLRQSEDLRSTLDSLLGKVRQVGDS